MMNLKSLFLACGILLSSCVAPAFANEAPRVGGAHETPYVCLDAASLQAVISTHDEKGTEAASPMWEALFISKTCFTTGGVSVDVTLTESAGKIVNIDDDTGAYSLQVWEVKPAQGDQDLKGFIIVWWEPVSV